MKSRKFIQSVILLITVLSKIFIKDRDNFSDVSVKRQYGLICSIWGVFLNFLLFGAKLTAGAITGSLAVTADAVHNLTDSLSSVIAFLSFLFTGSVSFGKKIKKNFSPEHIAGFIIGTVLAVTGIRLGEISFNKILNPESLNFSYISVAILILSVIVKLYMAYYNLNFGKKLSSPALKAAAADCFCDSFSTVVSLGAVFLEKVFSLKADGYGGLLVSLFIVFAGCKAAFDSVKPFLPHKNKKEKNASDAVI